MGFMIDHWDFSVFPAQQQPLESEPLQTNHWYHCERMSPELRTWLLDNGIPESTVDQLLADETRPSFHQYDADNFMLILRGINMNSNDTPDNMLSVRILYYQGILISTRKIPSRSILEIRQALEKKSGPGDLAELLLQIIDGLSSKIDLYLEGIDNAINAFDINDSETYKAIDTQKALLRIKRFIRPQLYAIRDFSESEISPLIQHEHHAHYALNNITRINETIDFYLGELDLIRDEIRHLRDEQVNQNSYLFTVVAAIFLPTSFLTGLLGINIGGMPGMEDGNAFWWFCAALMVIFGAEIWLLRYLKFFNKG
ncbi:zinc transporter ZntB [Vibrio sp. AK197]